MLTKLIKSIIVVSLLIFCCSSLQAQKKPAFKVIGFYTGKEDLAHISFMHEAHIWFTEMGKQHNFIYDSTNNWSNLNSTFLSQYQLVIFLDSRPDSLPQREAFEQYMEHGGAWMGFHFSAFALTPSDFPQNWDWYHNKFLGSGEYGSNTWRPTTAVLKVENKKHRFTKNLPATFTAAPNEWYRWQNDLRRNPDIQILLSIDSSSFPLGTGPKPYEIWHSGYYPVAWTNKKYRMIYFNMGHNDMDYDGGTNATLSSTFSQSVQNKMILNTVMWLGSGRKK